MRRARGYLPGVVLLGGDEETLRVVEQIDAVHCGARLDAGQDVADPVAEIGYEGE